MGTPGDPLGIFGGRADVPPWAVRFGLHPPYPGGSFDEYLDPRSPHFRADVAAVVVPRRPALAPDEIELHGDELDTARRQQARRAGELVAHFLRTVDGGRADQIRVAWWDEDVAPRRRTLRERWDGSGSVSTSMTAATTQRRYAYASGHLVYQRQDSDSTLDPPRTGTVQVIVFTSGQVGVTVSGTCAASGMLSRTHEVAGHDEVGDGPRRPAGYAPLVYVAAPGMHPGELPFYRGDHRNGGPWPGRGCTRRELEDAVAFLARHLEAYTAGSR